MVSPLKLMETPRQMLQEMLEIAIRDHGENAPSALQLRSQLCEMELRAERNQQAMFHVGGVKASQETQKEPKTE